MRILRVRDPIPIQANVNILDHVYNFEYQWTNVDNTYVNFHDSYLSLKVVTSPADIEDEQYEQTFNVDLYGTGTKHRLETFPTSINYNELKSLYPELLEQKVNLYCIIDSVDIEMVYELPEGGQKALKIHDSSMHPSRARKMIALKEQSCHDLDKSVYGEDLSTPQGELKSFARIMSRPGKEIEIAIPLYLISGLGIDPGNLIKVKHMKMMFKTSTIEDMLENIDSGRVFPYCGYAVNKFVYVWQNIWTDPKWFEDLKIKSAEMVLVTAKDVKIHPKKLYRTIPTYTQIDYQDMKVSEKTFLVNRAIPFQPEYILFWFTRGDTARINYNVPCRGIWPVYISCILGNIQMFPQTNFPSSDYADLFEFDQKHFDPLSFEGLCPNRMLYDLWADHSDVETKLTYEKWLKHPVYIIPCNALMDVNNDSGIEMNLEMTVEIHDLCKGYYNNLDRPDGFIRKDRKDEVFEGPYGEVNPTVESHAGYFYYQINDVYEEYTHRINEGTALEPNYKDIVDLAVWPNYMLHMLAVRNVTDK